MPGNDEKNHKKGDFSPFPALQHPLPGRGAPEKSLKKQV
jgi:hypothetical protein